MAALIDSSRSGETEPGSETTLFHRRIEFHVAKKPFNGFNNNNINGFKLVTLNPPSEHQNNSGLGKKPEQSDLLENGWDSELGFRINFQRIGAGLRNLGNTCFLNSVLQCLTYTEPLAAYLQSGKHQNSCRTAGFCALCAIQKHVSRALQSTGRILEPKDLVSNLRCISRNFRNARQEDAHEYMVNLLESMHKCCLPSGVPSESPSAYDKSLVHKIFGGRLRSQVKCMQCFFCSNKFDPFLDLSLEIAKADSLDKALRHFTAKEMLDGGSKEYQCEQCKQKVKALKQLTVYKAPNVLAVHLKRFGSHIQGQKIDKKVAFPPTLDLKPFVTGPYEGDLKYTLYGVLVHAGWSTHSGHYYCFVRTSSGMWYSLDDNQVVQVSEKRVLEQKAYMLFYFRDRKRSPVRKPGDVIQKENMGINVNGNAACSKPNLELKGKFLNSSTEKILNDSFSTAASERNVDSSVPDKTALENISSPSVNGTTIVNSLGLRANSKSESVLLQPSKESIKDELNIESVGHKTGLSSTFEGPSDAFNLGPAVNSNNSSDTVQNLNVASVCCSEPGDSIHRKKELSSGFDSSASGNHKGITIDISQPADKQPSISGVGGMPTKKDCENTEMIGGSPKKTGGKTTEETAQNGLTEKVLPPMPENTNHLSMRKKRKPLPLKVKKKPFKCQLASASLSSSIIFGAALFQQKKTKQRKLQKKSCILSDSSGGADIITNLGPSVANPSLPISTSHYSEIEKENFVSNDKTQNIEQRYNADTVASGDVISNELNERVAPSGSSMSAKKQPLVRLCTANGTNYSGDHSVESRLTDVMGILTRGLDQTAVARWDGIGITSEKSEILAAEGTTQIGYIGDEWDEEYDRGKRKKIRGSKIDFGGPNLFQEFATKNSKKKRAKLDKSRYANQPFRI